MLKLLLILLFSVPAFSKETRVKIAIIDSGLNVTTAIKPFLCKGGHKAFDPWKKAFGDASVSTHGTNVAGLISSNLNPKKQCIMILRASNILGNALPNVDEAIRYAISRKVQYINMSFGGEAFNIREALLIKKALKKGIKISVAAGNRSGRGLQKDEKGNTVLLVSPEEIKTSEIDWAQDLDKKCNFFPACYLFSHPNFHIVGTDQGEWNQWRGVDLYGNFGSMVKYKEHGTRQGMPVMTGTSQATAIHTGKWASGKLK